MANQSPLYDWPEPKWTQESWPLTEVCQDFNSPLLVKLDERDVAPSFGDEVEMDAPFVVYSKRRRTKVYAENLAWDGERKQYVPSGPVLEIPKDYTGQCFIKTTILCSFL